jgi:hypothetical protein
LTAPSLDLDAACEAEVHALHEAFEDWFTGRSTADDFARIEQALDVDFAMVTPSGALTNRAALIDALRAAHASLQPDALRMRVSDLDVLRLHDDLRLVRYVEHHEGARACRRRSSAIFRRDLDAPGGVRWLSVHETWLDGHAPAPGS